MLLLWSVTDNKASRLCLKTNLAICQSSRSCTYTVFLQKGSKLILFSLYEQQFRRYLPIFKIATFGHDTWSLAKVPEVAHILSFHPRGSKLSLFSLYGQRFLRYGPIFKIPILGHDETWQLAKVPEIAHILPKLPPSPKFHSVLLYQWPFPRYLLKFKNPKFLKTEKTVWRYGG